MIYTKSTPKEMQFMYPSNFYTHVHVDIPHELMKHVIGTKGKWFHVIKEKCMVSYVWFNKKRSIVEIWGPINYLMSAYYSVLQRITFIKERFAHELIISDKEVTQNWPNDSYAELDLNSIENFVSHDMIKFLIGRNGQNFKSITKASGVSFIWYNSQKHCIQIWGLSEDIKNSMSMLQSKITQITQISSNFSQFTQDMDEEISVI
jgi:hypothetical protein